MVQMLAFSYAFLVSPILVQTGGQATRQRILIGAIVILSRMWSHTRVAAPFTHLVACEQWQQYQEHANTKCCVKMQYLQCFLSVRH